MVLAILVWYLHPPEMVPRPQEGLPMMILVLTPTPPTTPILPTPLATSGGRRKKKEHNTPLPPRFPPPCALCEKEGHQTNNFPSLPELRNLIPPNPTPSTPFTTASTTTTNPSSSKGLRTKFVMCYMFRIWPLHSPLLSTAMISADVSGCTPELPEQPTPRHVLFKHH
jgi:hypothetical protein